MTAAAHTPDLVYAGAPDSLVALAKLAAALSRPFGTFAPGHVDCGGLAVEDLHALRQHAAFRGPLDRFACAQIAGPGYGPTRRQMLQLPHSAAGRLLILLLTEPMDQLERASLLLAAAVLHRRILAVTDRRQRQHLRKVLGVDAFGVATLEAPILYPSLAIHADGPRFAAALESTAEIARASLFYFGFALLASTAAPASKWLARLSLKRLPPSAVARLEKISPAEARLVFRLLERRMPPWSALIA